MIAGFSPTRIETAHRHLLVGRLTALDLASQVIGIGVMIVLALITRFLRWCLVASIKPQPS